MTLLLVGGLMLPASLGAQVLSSIDFTPIEDSAWGGSSVRLDFGEGNGLGTITFEALNGGSFGLVVAGGDYNLAPYGSYQGPTTLSNGAIFSPSQEVVFTTNFASGVLDSGFRMTVTLDSGLAFTEGSVFSARSLGLTADGGYQELRLVSGLAAAYDTRLPTDDLWGPPPDFIETSTGVYQPGSVGGNSQGRAFEITGSSFVVEFVGNYNAGGNAFTIATAPVPEPSAAFSIGLVGMFALLCRKRRS